MGKMSELEMMVKELRGCGEKLIRIAEEMTEMFSASVQSEPEEMPAVEEKKCTQRLDVMLDKRNRNGKKVTLIVNFDGSEDALKQLAKELKQHCGVGGSARGGEILIQGDFRNCNRS